MGKINVRQDSPFGEIYIESREDAGKKPGEAPESAKGTDEESGEMEEEFAADFS